MEFTLSIGWAAVVLLAIGSLVVGIATEFFGEPAFTYEWVATGIAAFVGAIFASEFVVGLRAFEPVWDGTALLPALAGGVVVGLVTAVVLRLLMTQSLIAHRPGHA